MAMTEFVFDASAVIAFLQDEPGARQVQTSLSGGLLSAVNLAEIAQWIMDVRGEAAARLELEGLPCEAVAFDQAQAQEAAALRRTTRARGLSLGDRACLALAKLRGLPVITADRAWATVDVGVEVVLIR
jgi:PIN domain nuclease of toxin-antitoxin system